MAHKCEIDKLFEMDYSDLFYKCQVCNSYFLRTETVHYKKLEKRPTTKNFEAAKEEQDKRPQTID